MSVANNIINQDISFLTTDKELQQPNTTLKLDRLEQIFHRHDQGYLWLDLIPENSFLEVVLIVWLGGTGSAAHDHGHSLSLTTILPYGIKQEIAAVIHRVRNSQFISLHNEVLQPGKLHVVLPFQIHEIKNDSDEPVVSLHVYCPRRR